MLKPNILLLSKSSFLFMWCLNEAIPSDAYTKNESTGGHGGKTNILSLSLKIYSIIVIIVVYSVLLYILHKKKFTFHFLKELYTPYSNNIYLLLMCTQQIIFSCNATQMQMTQKNKKSVQPITTFMHRDWSRDEC